MKKVFALLLIAGALVAALIYTTSRPQQAENPVSVEAETKSQNLSDEEMVRRRSTERWEALIALDMAKVYSFATPQYRQTFNLAHLHNQYGSQVRRLAIFVENVEIKESAPPKASVIAVLDYETEGFGQGPLRLQQRSEEAWIKLNGQWWYVEPR